MPVVYFPYRWLPRTVLKNLDYGWWYFWNGVRNIARYWRVVWHQQGEPEDLLRLIEFAIRGMERRHPEWTRQFVRDKRDMRVAAELCRRLSEQHVYSACDEEWRKVPLYFESLRYSKTRYIGMPRDEMKLLGKILGRKLMSWWSQDPDFAVRIKPS